MDAEQQANVEINLIKELEAKVADRTVTLQERNVELAQANHELEQLDEMKSEFVSLVSHELRAPLTTLNGGLEMAMQNADTLPEQARRILETMMYETTRLTSLVQTILDVTRLEAGKVGNNPWTGRAAPINGSRDLGHSGIQQPVTQAAAFPRSSTGPGR